MPLVASRDGVDTLRMRFPAARVAAPAPRQDTGQTWMRVGRSSHPDAATAGADAAAQALQGGEAALLVVFAAHHYDAAALLRAVRIVAPDVPLVGCSTAGEIATSGPGDAGVVVTALGGPGLAVRTASGDTKLGLREAGAAAATCIEGMPAGEYQVLLLLTDGLAGDQQEIVRGAYGVAGATVPLVGGCAGDGLEMRRTVQLHGDEVLDGAVVGVALSSSRPLGIGVRHGWRPVGEPMLVTRSAENRVHSLDERPALDVYLEGLGAPEAAWHDAAEFTRFALTHPLGMARRIGEPQVRFVAEADFANRALVCIAEVPQGGLAWFMEGDDASVLAATDAACYDALAPLAGRPPAGILAFDCIARRGVLGDPGIVEEIQRIASQAGGAPVAGFYTYGEIARTKGLHGFHNQTLVVLAIG